ncbi:methyl-accepting chemotaxis protein [Paenibacillus camelliae]|uniref:methyl-accepting chemotaxis protein n=1 Tax=Paenibacillus camelliae TaxID=512410 RepID=UPI0020426702|nr:methyl-accepting chemotaxis protein [Paenibacillus camelliae]MCM3633417.1 methyl-accepting chemotaxis protein [Paenibacillus camelliae]
MKWIRLKSLRSKMLLSFSLIIVLVVIFGIYTFSVIVKSNEEAENILEKELPLLMANEGMQLTIATRISTARAYLLYGGDYRERFDSYTEEGKGYEEIARGIGVSEEFNKLIEQTVAWRTYVTEHVFNEYEKGNVELARKNLADKDPMIRQLIGGYQELATEKRASIMEIQRTIVENGQKTAVVAVTFTTLVIFLSIAIAIVSSRLITTPIIKVMHRMKLIASGDLTQKALSTTSNDEVGQLVDATNQMSSSLHHLISEINSVSGSITSQSEELTQSAADISLGSEQIASTMQELAVGTESQASNASQLASVAGTYATRIQEVNTSSGRMEQSSNEVLEMTRKGGQYMETSSKQMKKINRIVRDAVQKVQGLDKNSQEISGIVAVIHDIASQTNLLALNAAIEAARAGEHGRGFAIVADEVRKLSEQVSASIEDITKIVQSIKDESSIVTGSLKDGYKEVMQGTIQIQSTQETFYEISSAVSGMADNIRTTSESLSLIAAKSETMNESISEIAAISEESAAGVEETSASSQQISSSINEVSNRSAQLAKLADHLDELVNQFKL